MYSTAEFKKGLKVELEGVPYTIVDFQHVKPGKGGAFVRTKLKSLLSGRVIDQTFRSGEKVSSMKSRRCATSLATTTPTIAGTYAAGGRACGPGNGPQT